jgi:hypothetical protein
MTDGYCHSVTIPLFYAVCIPNSIQFGQLDSLVDCVPLQKAIHNFLSVLWVQTGNMLNYRSTSLVVEHCVKSSSPEDPLVRRNFLFITWCTELRVLEISNILYNTSKCRTRCHLWRINFWKWVQSYKDTIGGRKLSILGAIPLLYLMYTAFVPTALFIIIMSRSSPRLPDEYRKL